MLKLGAWIGQGLVYALIAVVIGVLSDTPAYRGFPEDSAELVLSFSHGGARKGACRELSPEELAELAPNMRRPKVCPRERVPVTVRLELDGNVLIERALPPAGLAGDGPSRIYAHFAVPAGVHRLAAFLRDTARETGFDYAAEKTVSLAADARFVVDFRADHGGFIFGGAAGTGQSTR
jgi:hypothetical protein